MAGGAPAPLAVIWTRAMLLQAAGLDEVQDTTRAVRRVRKGITSRKWQEAVRCAEIMLELTDVRRPRDGEPVDPTRLRAIEITVVESEAGRPAALAHPDGVEILPGGGDGGEA